MLKVLSIKNRFVATGIFILALMIAFMVFLMVMISQLAEVPLQIVTHPLQVSNAAYFANIEVLKMQNSLEDMFIWEEKYEMDVLVDKINDSEDRVFESLELIENNILGVEGKVLQAEAKRLFESWKPIRLEIIQAIRLGDKERAIFLFKNKDQEHAGNLERKLVELNRYARTKAIEFQNEVLTLEKRLMFWSIIGIIFVAVLIISSIVNVGSSVLFSIGSLSRQLKDIISSGKMKKVSLSGKDELVELSEIFNDLVSSLNSQLWVKEGSKRLFTILNRPGKNEDTLNDYISEISKYCGFISTSYYHLVGENLSIKASYNRLSFMEEKFTVGNGVIGECASRKIDYTLDYTQKSQYFNLDFPYNYVTVKPISSEHRVYGVMAIAVMKELSTIEEEYLQSAIKDLRSFLENMEQRKQIDILLENSIKTNQELVIRQEELEEFNKYKNEFFANVSHELKTPLNSIIILSNILNTKTVSNLIEEDNEKIEIINNAAVELLKIINNILDLSKIESGKTERNDEIFKVSDLIKKLENLYRPIISEKGLECRFWFEESATLYGDEEKIYHVISNFISNAIKFTDSGKVEVGFKLYYDDYPVKFEVSDTGVGIPEEKQSIIFEEFMQSDGSISRKYGGTGLGLSICKNYAALLDGQIDLDSEVGKGSTFTLKLPGHYIVSKESTVESDDFEDNENITSLDKSYEGIKILVCDDEPYNLFAIASILEDFGIIPITVSNVYEALEKLEDGFVDMIFMDLMMPEHDGFSSLEMIKEKYKVDIPVAIVTAAEIKNDDMEIIKENSYYLLRKPIIFKEIIEILNDSFNKLS